MAPFSNMKGLNTQKLSLAMEFMDILRVTPSLMAMTDRQLLDLRQNEVVKRVMKMYELLIKEAATIEENKERLYREYKKEQRGRLSYPAFKILLAAIAPFAFAVSIAKTLPPVEQVTTTVGIFTVKYVVKHCIEKRLNADKKPLIDLKKLILEEYSRNLENSAISILEADDHSRLSIPQACAKRLLNYTPPGFELPRLKAQSQLHRLNRFLMLPPAQNPKEK